MKNGLSDEKFWEIVDMYENGSMSIDDCIKELYNYTRNPDVVISDLSLLLNREVTKDEKAKVYQYLNKKSGGKVK